VGVDAFRDMVEADFKSLKQAGIDRVRIEDLDRVRAQFLDPDWRLASVSTDLVQSSNDPLFARWLRRNSKPHKIPGMAAIVVPIKGTGRPPGDITSDEMRKLADLADRFSQGFLRVTHSQDLVFPAVPSAKLAELYEALQPIGFAQPIQGLIGDMVACPGGDFCALANARSLPIADEIANRYANLDEQENLGPLELKISGCMNSCGHHHIGHIGILGVDKDGAAFYQLLLGGHSGHGDRASLGKIVGRAFSEAEIPDAVEAILDEYLESRLQGETFHQALQRLGPAVFIEAANAVRQKVSPPSMAASTLEQA
jgi:sulfite reductase (NADPH) hemoprotein beta-component